MRREALNRHFQTPKFTYDSIVHAFWQQQTQSVLDAQRKAAEKEAIERELRLRAEQQRQLGRLDGHGHGQGSQQPRRF